MHQHILHEIFLICNGTTAVSCRHDMDELTWLFERHKKLVTIEGQGDEQGDCTMAKFITILHVSKCDYINMPWIPSALALLEYFAKHMVMNGQQEPVYIIHVEKNLTQRTNEIQQIHKILQWIKGKYILKMDLARENYEQSSSNLCLRQ